MPVATGGFKIADRRQASGTTMRNRSEPRARRTVNLYSIIERLQRKLEQEGLSAETVDSAVVNALATAARAQA